MLRNEKIKNGIFITHASLIIGDYKFASDGNKEFVVYPSGEKTFLFVSFVIDKAIEKKLGFIYVTSDVGSSYLIDYQHVRDLNQRSFFFELSGKEFDLLGKLKIAGFETDKTKSRLRPTPKDCVHVSPFIIDFIPSEQIELVKLINQNNLIPLLSKMSLLNTDKNKKEIPEKFFCIIQQDVMNEPVICTLDGKTYEKSAIMQWLTKHRTAPHNREPMDKNQTLEDVLIPDHGLKELINTFRLEHPELFNESDPHAQNIQKTSMELKF